MTKASRIGTLVIISGWALNVVGALAWVWKYPWWLCMSFCTIGLFVTYWGTFLSWRARQYTAKANTEKILTDSRPHVLYLRAFQSDISTAKGLFLSRWGQLATPEEQLRDALRPIGDLVAIGRPGEHLPVTGAARIYASEEEWKEEVARQMREARLVVIRAGERENLFWELKEALDTLNPQKVLILALDMRPKHYESFRTNVGRELDISLPSGSALWRPRFGYISGFIAFAPDCKPSFFPLRAPYLRREIFQRYRSLFKFALKPVFESFGVEWQPPSVKVETVLVRMAVMFWFALVAFQIISRPVR